MPLNPVQLQADLYRIATVEKPPDPFTAALKISAAYSSYAAQGIAGGFPFLAPGPGAATMSLSLGSAFSVLPGLPPVVASGFATMLTLFWTGATFVSTVPPGIAAPPIGLPALIPTLTALFSVPNTAETYALTLATTLDVCTRTVLVTLPQPPPAPPIVAPVL